MDMYTRNIYIYIILIDAFGRVEWHTGSMRWTMFRLATYLAKCTNED